MDANDGAVMFYGMVFMLLVYLAVGVLMGVDQDEKLPQAAPVESRLQNVYRRATDWVSPRLESLHDLPPAISSALLGLSADMPLLIPVKDLEERGKKKEEGGSTLGSWLLGPPAPQIPASVAWSFDVLSASGQKRLVVRQTKFEDGSLGWLEVLDVHKHGEAEGHKCLGKMDRDLKLYDGEGDDFGQLALKQSGAYELKESATGRHRLLVTPNMDVGGSENFTITWRPRRRVLATVTRSDGHLKVMPTKGVDAVLVVLCCVGLFVFRLDAEEAPRPALPRVEAKAVPSLRSATVKQAVDASSQGRKPAGPAAGGAAGNLLEKFAR